MPADAPVVVDIDSGEARLLVDSGAILLDVREDDEWATGHAPQAVHLPMGLVAERAHQLSADATVVCICRMGGRSASAAATLASAGYDVRNVAGGMLAWEEAGLPVESSGSAPGRVV